MLTPPPEAAHPVRRPTLYVPPGTGRTFAMGKLISRYTVLPEQTDGAYMAAEQPVAPGVLVVPHVHARQHQASRVLEGTLGFLVGDETYTVPAGGTIIRPARVRHALWNAGPGPAFMEEISSPGGEMAAFFDQFDALTQAGQVTAASVMALAAPYGIRYLLDLIPGLEAAHGVSAVGGWWEN